MTVFTKSRDETIKLGEEIGKRVQPGDVIAMEGTLASGKTTLTKGIAIGLSVEESVTSPTFTIVSEYYGRLTLYHVDVYRLDSPEDFINIGGEDMLYGNGITIIEWSEKVRNLIPSSAIKIVMNITGPESRKIEIENWNYGDL